MHPATTHPHVTEPPPSVSLPLQGTTVGVAYSVYASYECTDDSRAHYARQSCEGQAYFSAGAIAWFFVMVAGTHALFRRHHESHKVSGATRSVCQQRPTTFIPTRTLPRRGPARQRKLATIFGSPFASELSAAVTTTTISTPTTPRIKPQALHPYNLNHMTLLPNGTPQYAPIATAEAASPTAGSYNPNDVEAPMAPTGTSGGTYGGTATTVAKPVVTTTEY